MRKILDLYSSFDFFISATTGGGGLAMVLGTDVPAGVPGPNSIHIHGEVKKQTHSYTFNSENCKMNPGGKLI